MAVYLLRDRARNLLVSLTTAVLGLIFLRTLVLRRRVRAWVIGSAAACSLRSQRSDLTHSPG